jgi:hypothetical protein
MAHYRRIIKMKRIPSPTAPAAQPDDWDDSLDAEYARDVYFPHDPCGEISMAVRLKFRFQLAGYRVRLAEKPSPHFNVWQIRAVGVSAPQFPTEAEFHAQVIQILKSADLSLSKKEVTAQREANRIHVSFIFPPLKKKKARRRGGLANDHDRP